MNVLFKPLLTGHSFFTQTWQLFIDLPTELQESRLEKFSFVLLSYWFRPDWSFHG